VAGRRLLSWLGRSAHSLKRGLDRGQLQLRLQERTRARLSIYKSTYERGDGLASDNQDTSRNYRDHVLMWAQDVSRTLDWVETRADLDKTPVDRFLHHQIQWRRMSSLGDDLPLVLIIRVGCRARGAKLSGSTGASHYLTLPTMQSDTAALAPLVFSALREFLAKQSRLTQSTTD
jgi:hypothetical protein